MFPNRLAVRQAIRALARTLEIQRAWDAAGAEFHRWLVNHCYLGREAPPGPRSKAIAWSAAEEWPGSIEWYILDESVIGRPEHGGLFYEIPFADLERLRLVADSQRASRRRATP
jgi:hypothetical protein